MATPGSPRRWRRPRRASTWTWIVGVIVTAAGFGTVVASIFADQSTVADFARVPVGCVTTFEADASATLFVYVETRGRIDDIGECSNDDRTFDVEFDSEIVVNVSDASGQAVDQFPIFEVVSYDLPDYAGRAIGSLTVEEDRRYDVTVESESLGPVVAIGRRVVPNESGLAIAGAITVMVGGAVLVIALVIALVSRRRRSRGPWAPPTLDDRAVY
ncbi:MAG: hypothetical protein RIS41_955 [Actinomycetota bacterium]